MEIYNLIVAKENSKEGNYKKTDKDLSNKLKKDINYLNNEIIY